MTGDDVVIWLASAGLADGLDWDDVLYTAGLIIAVGAAVAVLWRAGRAAFACIHQISGDTRVIRAALFPESGPSLPDQVAELRAQMRPNGGSSMRDQLTRVETRQLELRTQVGALSQDVHELKTETDRQGERLDRHIDRHGGA